jgi:hypothetical protein
MRNQKIITAVFFLALFSLPVLAQSSDTAFQQAVAEYQKSPNKETADKVIKLAAAMDKLPAVPEEAREHFIKGSALFKEAKSPDDFKLVIDEFKQAVHAAPWWPDARYNYALAYESAGQFDSAVTNLKHYLLFKLSAAEAREVQDKIYVLEAKAEKAKLAPASAAPAASQAGSSDDWLKKLDGTRFIYDEVSPVQIIEIKGGMLIRSKGPSQEFGPGKEFGRWAITGHVVDVPSFAAIYTISDDGESVREDHPGAEQYNPPFIFHRSR